jgi:hypothetical protein
MTKILRRLVINEVSTVDRGAGVGVQIMLSKRAGGPAGRSVIWKNQDGTERRLTIPDDHASLAELAARANAAGAEIFELEDDDMTDATTAIDVAKRLRDGSTASTGALTKRDFRAAITAGGEALRELDATLTPERARARYVIDNPDGRALMLAERMAQSDPPPPPSAPLDVAKTWPAYAQLLAKAEEFRKSAAGAGLSQHQAYARVSQLPENRELRDKAIAEGLTT